MRGRIRSVKPDLFKSEKLWDLQSATGLPVTQAFVGLWCYADREGRFRWRPRELQSDILPYWDGDIGEVLDALAARRFVIPYTVDGEQFGCVRNWHEHQRPNAREAASVLPPPPHVQDGARTCVHVQDDETHVQDSASVKNVNDNTANHARTCVHVQDDETHVHARGEGKGRELEWEGKGKGREAPLAPVEPVASPLVIRRIPDDFSPTEELISRVVMSGYSRERFLARLDEYRLGPIGGARGVFASKLDAHLVAMAGKWKTWDASDRANQRAGPNDRLQKQADRVRMLREQEAEEERRAAAESVSS